MRCAPLDNLQPHRSSQKGPGVTTEANKPVIQGYFEAVNAGDKAAMLSLLTPDFVFKGMGRHPKGTGCHPDSMRYPFFGPPSAAS